jgi:hypothetical protein
MTNEVAVLTYLGTIGILVRLDRWKFAHDSFEEYFCGSYLARIAESGRILPNLTPWVARPEELSEVFSFLGEMLSLQRHAAVCGEIGLPALWREQLLRADGQGPPGPSDQMAIVVPPNQAEPVERA